MLLFQKPAQNDAAATAGAAKKEEEIAPVKEAEVSQSDKDPKTFSGCIVS